MIETLLVDGDIVAYRCAAATANDTEAIAVWQTSEMMTRILHETNAISFKCFLSGSTNFRYGIYPDYKANRRDMPKPVHLQAVRSHLVSEWNSSVTDGVEADDAMGIEQVQSNDNSTMIASIDKDMLMVPGLHYRFVDGTTYRFEDPGELFAHKKDKILGGGLKWFYAQMLMGDTADNIPGLKGIGPKKALKLLQNIDTEEEMIYTVKKAYEEHKVLDRFDEVADLLWIQREEGVKYTDRGL